MTAAAPLQNQCCYYSCYCHHNHCCYCYCYFYHYCHYLLLLILTIISFPVFSVQAASGGASPPAEQSDIYQDCVAFQEQKLSTLKETLEAVRRTRARYGRKDLNLGSTQVLD